MVKVNAVAALGLLGIMTQAAAAGAAVKVMPFGASIVTKCWRAYLWQKLQDAGIKNFNFVGSQNNGACGFPFDQDNEGHPGALVTDIANANQLPGWLNASRPDVIVMHIGTNDCINYKNTSVIIAAYSKLVDQMRACNSKMQIIVSQLIPLDRAKWPPQEPGQSSPQDGILALNNAILSWAAGKTTVQSPIVVVDNAAGYNGTAGADNGDDGEHPNDSGNHKIAEKFFPAVTAAVKAAFVRPEPNAEGGA